MKNYGVIIGPTSINIFQQRATSELLLQRHYAITNPSTTRFCGRHAERKIERVPRNEKFFFAKFVKFSLLIYTVYLHDFLIFFRPGMVAKYCDEYVCLCLFVCTSVCMCVLSVRPHNSKTARPNFAKYFMHFACARGSVCL